MPIFDRYIAVDWSANNGPKTGKDSIWIGEATASQLLTSRNPRTRAVAMDEIEQTLMAARSRGERVMVGFDFGFGYPQGAADTFARAASPSSALSGTFSHEGRRELGQDRAASPSPLVGEGARRADEGGRPWTEVWGALSRLIKDSEDNQSNRFEVAAAINLTGGRLFWGHPQGRAYEELAPRRDGTDYAVISERRRVESRIGGPQPVWKLYGAGSVGSQTLLGIPRLEALRRHPTLGPDIAIWPFDTDFERNLAAPIIIVEIYPSYFAAAQGVSPIDRDQVETCVLRYARMDREGTLSRFLSPPSDVSDDEREVAVSEEGWIAGVGHWDLKQLPSYRTDAELPKQINYLRDPDAIYAESFATIRAEADLAALPPALHDVAIRMIHACGMPDLAADIIGAPDVVDAARAALHSGAPIFCDCEMVRSGVIRRQLPGTTELAVTLNAPEVSDLARRLGATRSAAAVELWRPRLAGAIVLIGNAPTALFHLLEMIEAGGPRPAAIVAAPVGFVGAAESKALLAENSYTIPFVTVLGRRGGSAIASAALNAITRGMTQQ